jgi:menaquinone-specific isochorismate synthase
VLADPVSAFPTVGMAAERARRLGRAVLTSWTRPCAVQDPIEVFAQNAGTACRGLWLRPSTGEALVASGSAFDLVGEGAERFEQVARAWRDVLADAVIEGATADSSGGPVAFGGFSFDPRRPRTAPWKAFSDARMVLPEQLLVIRRGAAWLTSNAMIGGEAPNAGAAAPATIGQNAQPPELTAEAWQAAVAHVARGIRGGDLGVDKVVLARAQHVRANRPIEAALRHLAASYPSCTVFAIAHRDACFLGATPELLIELRHGLASTAALAGSAPRGSTAAEDDQLAQKLLSDAKEQREHALVVAALSEGLAQTCTRTVAAAQPRVHKLANLQHLLTPIRGQVAPGSTVLDLVARLHPTPAVGGYPRQRALELIRRYESLDRGWYAGPIGWMNRDGEGEFVVGLRSALVRGASATLFAGCGIVGDSDPATEAAEWGWKLRPMLAALDAESGPHPLDQDT